MAITNRVCKTEKSYTAMCQTFANSQQPYFTMTSQVNFWLFIYFIQNNILGQKSSTTTFSEISHLKKKACLIKLKICMRLLGCRLNTSMILKAATHMNTWKIRREHGHPLIFYFTRFDQITQLPFKEMPTLTLTDHLRSKIIGMCASICISCKTPRYPQQARS